MTELKKALDREFASSSQLRVENSQLKDAIAKAQAKVQKAEEEAQSYYDQGFTDAAESLQKSVLKFPFITPMVFYLHLTKNSCSIICYSNITIG